MGARSPTRGIERESFPGAKRMSVKELRDAFPVGVGLRLVPLKTHAGEGWVLTTMVEPRDETLASDAQAEPGGPAFRELYRRHAPDVLRFARRLVGNALAEDVLQESFFRVFQHLDRYDTGRPFRPWLFQIARNAGLNALRGQRKAPPLEAARSESGRVPARAAAREAAGEARLALEDLPPEQRALLLQRHLVGMTQIELAESWGCTERTIRNRLEAASQALTRALIARRQGGVQ